MNEFEENVYVEIKNELIQSAIDKKVDTYFVNKNELTHYYNVGKKLLRLKVEKKEQNMVMVLLENFQKD